MLKPRQGVVIAERYTLVRQLARGGMGSVWLARHRDLDLDVTVKLMAPALVASTEARIRFEREAKVAARLRSQHVVQVHDYGVDDGTPYIIMELLKGETLSARFVREGRLTVPATARLAEQICKALRTAHEAGLVHRDLKPSNIFLALKDADDVVKVLDFGVAKADSARDMNANTATGVLLGTVHYMSPEQIKSSRSVDARSDLWSVGVILYRALTGVLPVPGEGEVDVMVRICSDPIPPPSAVAPGLSQWVDGFFARALAKNIDERFQSAGELSDAFCAIEMEERAPMSLRSAPMPKQSAPIALAPLPSVADVDHAATALFQAPTRIELAPTAPPPSGQATVAYGRPPMSAATVPLPTTRQADDSHATTVPRPVLYPAAAPPSNVPQLTYSGQPAMVVAFLSAKTQQSPPTTFSGQPYATVATAPGTGYSQLSSTDTSTANPPRANRSRWPLWAAATTIALVVVLGLALRALKPAPASAATAAGDLPQVTPTAAPTSTSAAPAPSSTPPPEHDPVVPSGVTLPTAPIPSPAQPITRLPRSEPAQNTRAPSPLKPGGQAKANPLDRKD